VATAVDSAWSESVRAELAGTFAASRAPYAAEAWARLETDLTEYGRRWRDLRRQACVATHVERTQSTADMDLQVGCLQQARSSLSAMVDVLRAGDDVVLARAHALSADLPDLERCGDVRDLARSSAPARTLSVEDSQLLEQLRDELARVGALNTAGRYRDAVAVAAQLWAKSDRLAGHPVAAQIGMSYGEAQCESGAVEEGLSTLREAFRRALAADADVVAARVALKLAFYLDDQAGRAHEALWLVDFADAIASRTDGGEQLGARVLSVRAQVYRALGRWDDALVDAEAALQQRIDALGPEHPDVAVSRNNLGLLLYDLDRPAQGVEHLEAASSIWRAQLGENHPEVAKARNNLAMVLERTGRLDEAEREYRASLNIRESVFGAQHPEAIAVRHNLGLVMLSRDEPAAAEELIAQAVEQWETQTPDDQRTRAIAYNSLGLARAALEKKEEALAAFERSVELAESSYGPQHPQICQFWNNLARNLADADPDRARELAERSLATCEPQLGAEHRSVRSARELLEALP
jgi:tetratricopeptide (TPR) repeat protein